MNKLSKWWEDNQMKIALVGVKLWWVAFIIVLCRHYYIMLSK